MPGVVYRPRTYGPQRPGMPSRRILHPHAYDPYGLDVATKEDLEFLDDDVDDDGTYIHISKNIVPTANWRNELRNVTKYDPSAFADEDGEALESNLTKVRAEEALSEYIAKKEDQEELARLIVRSLKQISEKPLGRERGGRR